MTLRATLRSNGYITCCVVASTLPILSYNLPLLSTGSLRVHKLDLGLVPLPHPGPGLLALAISRGFGPGTRSSGGCSGGGGSLGFKHAATLSTRCQQRGRRLGVPTHHSVPAVLDTSARTLSDLWVVLDDGPNAASGGHVRVDGVQKGAFLGFGPADGGFAAGVGVLKG